MKFRHKYCIKENNVSVIYIRFVKKDHTVANYVGQTKELLKGRPFRKNARGSSYRGNIKCKSVIVLRCPVSRLIVREAYFVLHYKPKTQNIRTYFKRAWHLLTKEKLMECLTYMYRPEDMSPNDWKLIHKGIKAVENAKTKKEEEEALIKSYILDINPQESGEAFKQLKEEEKEKIRKGELLDPTSTLPQQRIWLENFQKKFGLTKAPLPTQGLI